VGNSRRTVISQIAGRGAIVGRLNVYMQGANKNSPEAIRLLELIKKYENEGYHYENADASLDLLILDVLGRRKTFFELKTFKLVMGELDLINVEGGQSKTSAMLKVQVAAEEEITAAEGNGPVNAMDGALRKALLKFYPELKETETSEWLRNLKKVSLISAVLSIPVTKTLIKLLG